MFLLSKIVSKITQKLKKLHLTIITLFKANFNKIFSKLHHLFLSQTPYTAMAWLQQHYFCAISEDF